MNDENLTDNCGLGLHSPVYRAEHDSFYCEHCNVGLGATYYRAGKALAAAQTRIEELERERDEANRKNNAAQILLSNQRQMLNQVHRAIPNAVKQTTPTNCFAACVASILNVPIESIPGLDGKAWDWDLFEKWLAMEYRMQAIEIGFGNGGTIYPVIADVPCVISGKSPRGDKLHAVCGEYYGIHGFRLTHDVNVEETWIDGEPTHATFFVPISPRKFIDAESRLSALTERCDKAEKDRNEARELYNLIAAGLRWTGDGYEWLGGEYDYRIKPEESVAYSKNKLAALTTENERLKAEIVGAIELIPPQYRVGCFEGGGPENIVGTLCLSIAKMRQSITLTERSVI